MLYVNDPTQTLNELVFKYFGYPDGQWQLPLIQQRNLHLHYHGGSMLAPYQFTYLPGLGDSGFHNDASIAPYLSAQPRALKHLIKELCRASIHPLLPLHALQAGSLPSSAPANDSHKMELETLITLLTFTHGSLHVAEKKTERFEKALHAMNRALSVYRAEYYGKGKLVSQAMRNHYAEIHLKAPYQELMHAYRTRLALRVQPWTTELGQLRRSSLVGKYNGFTMLHHLSEADAMLRSLKYVKWLGHGVVGVELALNGFNIFEEYEEGNSEWKKDASVALGGFAGAYALGEIAASILIPTPIGWVALIIGGAAAAGGEYLGKKITEAAWDHYRVHDRAKCLPNQRPVSMGIELKNETHFTMSDVCVREANKYDY
jgi:hypothetical protein